MSGKHLAAPRKDMPMPLPEELTIIGLDTDHKAGDHPLWDERILEPVPEWLILSIMTEGVTQVVNVTRNGKLLEVVAGRKRVRACREANRRLAEKGVEIIHRVPCKFEGGDEADLITHMAIENELRTGDDILTRAAKAARMVNLYSVPRSRAGKAFRCTEATIGNYLRIDSLSIEVKAMVRAGEVKVGAALAVTHLPRERQAQALREALKAGPVASDDWEDNRDDEQEEIGEESEAPAKKKTSAQVKAALKGERAVKGVSVAELRKLVRAFDKKEINLEPETILTLRVLIGDTNPNQIKGLTAALKHVRGEK